MRVYKYRGGDKTTLYRDIKSLIKSQIYSASIESLNDPFEAKVKVHGESFEIGKYLKQFYSEKHHDNIKKVEVDFFRLFNDFLETSKTWGVYSLSKSYKDELLWSYYADSHRGFCVEYDLEKLMEYKIDTEPIIDVKYEKNMPTITSLDFINIEQNKKLLHEKLIGTKSKCWEHEDEIRIVTGQIGLFDYDFRALKSIYFGYRSDDKLRNLIMRVLKGRGLKYYIMQPKDGSYKLEEMELDDPYLNAPKYLYSVSPVEDGVPYLDDNIKPYKELILKAIEIVRREPYCDKVLDADISNSKGTKENPVFFIMYQRSDGLPRNYFISKNEILKEVN